MHFLIVVDGSAGDLHPYLAIGKELLYRGNKVTFLVNDLYAELVTSLGFNFVSSGPPRELKDRWAMPEMWEAKTAFATAWNYGVAPNLSRRFKQITDLLDSETVLVSSQMSCFAARLVQDSLGVPLITAWVSPMQFMSSRVPMELKVRNSLFPRSYLENAVRTWFINRFVLDRLCKDDINKFRKKLNLPPVANIIRRWVHSPISSVGLFPPWFSPPQRDWPSSAVLTGFPLFDVSSLFTPNIELERFLSSGSPPVLVATGSAMSGNKSYFTNVINALSRMNLRGILLTSEPKELPTLPPGFMYCQGVSLPNVLPRVKAFIHHGGIGTIAQAFAAGVPQLIVPSAMDQIDNAARIYRIGAGLQLAMPISIPKFILSFKAILEDKSMIRQRDFIRKEMELYGGGNACAKAADIFEKVGLDYLSGNREIIYSTPLEHA